MGLETDHAVDDLGAHQLQRFRPIDVRFLVEARLELHHGHDFLAAAHGLGKKIHELRVGAGAINGLLDDQHVGVVHGLAQQRQHAFEAFERLVYQHIALAQLAHDGHAALQLARPYRLPWRKQQRGIVDQIDKLPQAHQIDRAGHAKQCLRRQMELREQQVGEERRAARGHLQAHGLAVMPVVQALAQGHAQIADIFLVDGQLRMARGAELRELDHFTPREQLLEMGAHDARQAHEHPLLSRNLGRQAHQPGQGARHLHDRDLIGATEGVRPLEPHDEIQRLVRDLGKGMRGVQPQRNQQRPDFGEEILAHPAPLRAGAIAVRKNAYAMALERRHQGLVVELVLACNQVVGLLHQGLERGRRVDALPVAAEFGRDVRRGPDLEELIEVGRHDT